MKKAAPTVPNFIKTQFAQLAKGIAQIPGLHAKQQARLNEASTLTERKDLRKRAKLQYEAFQIGRQIEELRDESKFRDFEAAVLSYMSANEESKSFALMKQKAGFRESCAVPDTEDMCSDCRVPLLRKPGESRLICPVCFRMTTFIESTTASLQYGEEFEMISYRYRKINHFNERVTHVQGKETTPIDAAVLKAVITDLHRRRFKSPDQITFADVRQSLKNIKATKLYQRDVSVHRAITGKKPVQLTRGEEEIFRIMFMALLPVYVRYQSLYAKREEAAGLAVPERKKNFPSYPCVIARFAILIGKSELLPQIRLLKGETHLLRQDIIMEDCFREIGWQFTPFTEDYPNQKKAALALLNSGSNSSGQSAIASLPTEQGSLFQNRKRAAAEPDCQHPPAKRVRRNYPEPAQSFIFPRK